MSDTVLTAPGRIARESMTKRVADSIRASIVNGIYKGGEHLREVDLSERFGVSTSVIREAFHILQGEGLIVAIPYRGRQVISISKTEYMDLVLARASLESLATYLAVKRMDEEWLGKITECGGRLKSAKRSSFAEFVDLDLEFHSIVWKGARNEQLSKQLFQCVVPLLSLNTAQMMNPDIDYSDWEKLSRRLLDLETTQDPQGHQPLVKAIASGDAEAARKSMIWHILANPVLRVMRREIFRI